MPLAAGTAYLRHTIAGDEQTGGAHFQGMPGLRTTMKHSRSWHDDDRSLRAMTFTTSDLKYRAYFQADVTPIPELHCANSRTSTWSYDVLRQMFNQTFRKTNALSDIKSGVYGCHRIELISKNSY